MNSPSIDTDYDFQDCTFFESQEKKPKQVIYINKLEKIVRDHTQKIQSNRPILQQLQYHRKFFRKICQKQKQKLHGINIELMNTQHQRQMDSLQFERDKLYSMVETIHEEAEEKQLTFQLALKNLEEVKIFLLQSFEKIANQNVNFEAILRTKSQLVCLEEVKVRENKLILTEKQKIEHKYQRAISKLED